jgi:hypothetical protein
LFLQQNIRERELPCVVTFHKNWRQEIGEEREMEMRKRGALPPPLGLYL